jgi:ABC-type branched-subunit amino acid transport system ATPase component/MFS family permease
MTDTDPTQTPVGMPATADAAPSEKRGIIAGLRSYADLRHTPYGLTPAIVLGLIAFFQIFDSVAFTVAAPDIAADLEISIPTIIGILTTVGIFSTFGAIAVGYAADRTRRVPYIAAGTFFSGVFSIFASRAGSATSLGVPRVLDDVADEVSAVPRFALLADYYPIEARGRMISLVVTLRRVGSVLALIVVGALVVSIGWRTTLVLCGIPLLVMGVVSLVTLREPVRGYFERRAMGADEDAANRAAEPMSMGESWRATFGIRTIRRLIVAGSIGDVGDRMVALFFPFFLAEVYGLNAWERSLVAVPAAITALVGGVYGGVLIDRFTRRNPAKVLTLLAVYSLVASLGVAIYFIEPPLLILVVASAIFSFGAALIGPARFVVIANVVPPAIRVTGINITGIATLPALIFAGMIGGLVFSEYGYGALWLTAFPFIVVSALVMFTVAPFFELDMRAAFAATMARRRLAQGPGRRAGQAARLPQRRRRVRRGAGALRRRLRRRGGRDHRSPRHQRGRQVDVAAGHQRHPGASSGAVVFDGRDITFMPPTRRRPGASSTCPAGAASSPAHRAREPPARQLAGATTTTRSGERLDEVFEIFPVLVPASETSRPAALSGGEQQQLSLAQALLARPRLLMIDELSLGLSPAVVGELIEVVRSIHQRGVTIIVVEQSVNVALTIAEKAIFMEKGEVQVLGPPPTCSSRPDILRAVYVKGTGGLTDGPRQPRVAAACGSSSAARPVLEVESLVKRFGGVTALDGVTLELRESEVLGLIGPNGAGKTTLFDVISGFQRPDAGPRPLRGRGHHRPGRRRAVPAQAGAPLPGRPPVPVADRARDPAGGPRPAHSRSAAPCPQPGGLPQARRAERRARRRADQLSSCSSSAPTSDKFVKELSTGLRRIVDLACVLAAEPKVLLLDEPSSGIAQAEAESLGPLLRRIRFETGCSILIIEHDMPLISAVSDQLVALESGSACSPGARPPRCSRTSG